VFLAHPRTRERIADFGLDAAQLRVLNALPADLLGIAISRKRDHRFVMR
jgi:hypothetical protein